MLWTQIPFLGFTLVLSSHSLPFEAFEDASHEREHQNCSVHRLSKELGGHSLTINI